MASKVHVVIVVVVTVISVACINLVVLSALWIIAACSDNVILSGIIEIVFVGCLSSKHLSTQILEGRFFCLFVCMLMMLVNVLVTVLRPSTISSACLAHC